MNVDLFRGGSSWAEIAMSCFFGLLIAIFSRSLFNVFHIRLALACSNWIKTCLDSSSRILESCPLISFWHFCWYFEQVHVKWVKSAVRLCFVVLACLRSSWGQHYSVLALDTVHSPYLGIHSDYALSFWAIPAKHKQFRPIYRFFQP